MIREGIKRRLYSLYHFLWHKPFYTIRNSQFVWTEVINREGVGLFEQNPPRLDPVQERVLSELNLGGIAIIPLDEFSPQKDLFTDLENYAKGLLNKADTKSKKKFLQFLFERYPMLDFKNPFVKFALENRILDVANSYLEMYSKFRAFTLNLTVPVSQGSREVQSQKWHRDSEDRRLVKIFLYLTDVDATSGPFTYIRNSHSKGRWKDVFPQDPPYGSYPAEGAVEKIIPAEYITSNIGTKGTLIFCDTSGLHKGGYATQKERLMFTGVYTSKGCVNDLEYRYPPDFKLTELQMNGAQKYALEND